MRSRRAAGATTSTLLHPPYTRGTSSTSCSARASRRTSHGPLGAALRRSRSGWASARTPSTSCRAARCRRGSRTGRCWASPRLDRRRDGDRHLRVRRVDVVARAVRRRGRVHRRGVQPRAVRRRVPLDALVRARLGRAAGPDGLLRLRGDDRLGRALAAAFAALTSYVQRVLSTPVRHLRRRVVAVRGTLELRNGSSEPVTADHLFATQELSLQLLAAATSVSAGALLVLRLA